MPSIRAATNCPPVINILLIVTMRPLMLEGAVSAMYTGTVTDAPPVFEYQAKKNLKGRAN